MRAWLVYTLLTILMWGLWGFFPKLASNYIGPNSVLIFQTIGHIIVTSLVLIGINFQPEINVRGIVYAALAGFTGSLGALFFIYSMTRGESSVVVTMTALYPVITILLSFVFFRESITLKQGIGIIMALISMALFSL
jgi:transporter family protein